MPAQLKSGSLATVQVDMYIKIAPTHHAMVRVRHFILKGACLDPGSSRGKDCAEYIALLSSRREGDRLSTAAPGGTQRVRDRCERGTPRAAQE
jgi:hypothetical protein